MGRIRQLYGRRRKPNILEGVHPTTYRGGGGFCQNYDKKDKGEKIIWIRVKLICFFMTNAKYFPEEKAVYLKDKLRTMDDEKFSLVSTIELKDPTTLLLVSIFLGTFGIDRFMLGDTGMGILKLLTAGCCGVLTIIDWFTISKKTKEANFNKVMSLL